jgi:hypothetical protein
VSQQLVPIEPMQELIRAWIEYALWSKRQSYGVQTPEARWISAAGVAYQRCASELRSAVAEGQLHQAIEVRSAMAPRDDGSSMTTTITFVCDPSKISVTALMFRIDQALCNEFDSSVQFTSSVVVK